MGESDSGKESNKKLLLIGIGIILILGMFWAINNISYSEVKLDNVWEGYLGGDEEKVKEVWKVSNFSKGTQEFEVFTPMITTILILSAAVLYYLFGNKNE